MNLILAWTAGSLASPPACLPPAGTDWRHCSRPQTGWEGLYPVLSDWGCSLEPREATRWRRGCRPETRGKPCRHPGPAPTPPRHHSRPGWRRQSWGPPRPPQPSQQAGQPPASTGSSSCPRLPWAEHLPQGSSLQRPHRRRGPPARPECEPRSPLGAAAAGLEISRCQQNHQLTDKGITTTIGVFACIYHPPYQPLYKGETIMFDNCHNCYIIQHVCPSFVWLHVDDLVVAGTPAGYNDIIPFCGGR